MKNKLINHLIDYAKINNSPNLVIEDSQCSLFDSNYTSGKINLSQKQENDLINTFKLLSRSLKDELFANKKIKIKHQNKVYNCFLSVLPADKENKVVMNLEASNLDIKRITSLGFSRYDLKIIKDALSSKQGLILITGQANSGKTTSYYSLINHLNKNDKSFYSLEKYPACSLPFTTTLEINEKQSLNDYLEKLRKFDADVVGIDYLEELEEIKETIKRANNGHLIIATIEANNIHDAISKILKTGLDPKLLANSLNLIIGQKLMKKTCPYCLQVKKIDNQYFNFIKQKTKKTNLIKKAYFSPGCSRCKFSGKSRDFPVFELLKVSASGKIDPDYKTFIHDAVDKANNGLFSPEEIFKSFKK